MKTTMNLNFLHTDNLLLIGKSEYWMPRYCIRTNCHFTNKFSVWSLVYFQKSKLQIFWKKKFKRKFQLDCCVGVTFDAEANKMFHISDEKLYLKNIRTCPGKHFKTPKWDNCIKQLKKFWSKVLFFFLRWTARKNDSQKMRV